MNKFKSFSNYIKHYTALSHEADELEQLTFRLENTQSNIETEQIAKLYKSKYEDKSFKETEKFYEAHFMQDYIVTRIPIYKGLIKMQKWEDAYKMSNLCFMYAFGINDQLPFLFKKTYGVFNYIPLLILVLAILLFIVFSITFTIQISCITTLFILSLLIVLRNLATRKKVKKNGSLNS